MAALCLLSDEEENWFEDEEAMTAAEDDDVVAIEAPWAKVPLSTTVPDSPPSKEICNTSTKHLNCSLDSYLQGG